MTQVFVGIRAGNDFLLQADLHYPNSFGMETDRVAPKSPSS